MFAPYGGHFIETIFPGSEMWSTGWGEDFVLSKEYDGVHYDEWLCLEAIEKAIEPSKPDGWLLSSDPNS
ncbi:hypothetical protein [Brevundimonas sp.]|uniref:hypothetical protein n=1 Tax=Brevundimonas sp. TaxID=1871086 RepID=UPI003BAC4BD0